MSKTVRVAIIGDFNPKFDHHLATDESLRHAAAVLSIQVEPHWVSTEKLDQDAAKQLKPFDAIWCSSGSPYRSMQGAINGIRFARENDWPFVAT